jgi:hypothetical protein
MVEQEAVNFEVAGSSPASGAKHKRFIKEVDEASFCYS